MRMEDLDPPREQPGAAELILRSLQAHGLHWDGPVLWQSSRHDAYAAAVDDLLDRGLAFRCDCSRARLKSLGNAYDGHCRERGLGADSDAAVRVRLQGDCRITVHDDIQPPLTQELFSELGDFVIRRRDGLYAYQLAVVVDDAWQGINRVLRGSDLYDSTPRQVYLQRLFGLPALHYAHIPVIENEQGQKLSKQTHAAPLDDSRPVENLRLALRFLHQPSPPDTIREPAALLASAVDAWDTARIPAVAGIPERTLY